MSGSLKNNVFSVGLKDDLAQLIQLDQKAMAYPWDARQWQELSHQSHYLIFSMGDNPVLGFCLFQMSAPVDGAHLIKICFDPEYRGKGLASQLFLESLDHLFLGYDGEQKVFLEVESTNSRAISFYLKLGFEKVHLKKGFYSDGKDAFVMTLTV